MRLLRLFVGFTLSLTVILPIPVLLKPEVARAAPGGCVNDTRVQTDNFRRDKRCINGAWLANRLKFGAYPQCLTSRPIGHTYRRNECGGSGKGVEAIGHLRAIAWLNEQPGGSPVGVTPNAQWEVSLPGAGFADILWYDHKATADTRMQVIEAKVVGGPTYDDWRGQVDRYKLALQANGMNMVVDGTELMRMRDQFYFEDEGTTCDGGRGIVKRNFITYSPEPGLLKIEEVSDGRACTTGNNSGLQGLAMMKYDIDEDIDPELPKSGSWADPHLTTTDGLQYDLQSVGEFVLAETSAYNDMKIEVRFTAQGENVSVVSAAAMQVDEHVVEFGNDSLRVDGQLKNLNIGATLMLGDNMGVVRKADGYYVAWDGNSGPVFKWQAASAILYMPKMSDGNLAGLLGNADGDPRNDLSLRNGTALSVTTPANVLHGTFADSWRITGEESLFTYEPGKNTTTFTDLAFPAEIVTVHDLTTEQRTLATQFCEQAGVPAGPQFNACILDMAMTANTSLAALAAQQKEVALDPLAAKVDASGRLAVDFEGSELPQNVLPAKLTTDPSLGAFAGGFSGDASFRFYVQSLPSHVNGTLAFDLLTLGNWNSDADIESVTVEVDRVNVLTLRPGELQPGRVGTLANGIPFAVYRITVPFAHSRSQAEVKVRASGVDGLANQGFGVDNIAFGVAVTPPQVFQSTLPLAISDGVPGPGAGNIETETAQDEYRFSVAERNSIYLDFQACAGGSGNLRWTLLTAAGASVASGTCIDQPVEELGAGTYRLVVEAEREQIGAYRMQVFVVPPAQTFDVTLPATASAGSPAAGAGVLETKASVDEYRFTASSQKVYVDVKSCPNTLAWKLVDSAGNQVAYGFCTGGEAPVVVGSQYRLVVTPYNEFTGNYSIAVTGVPADVTKALTAGGAAQTVTTTAAGQNASFTFSGTAGQRVLVDLAGGTFDAEGWAARAKVLKPDGGLLWDLAWCGRSCQLDTTTLPTGGTYTVVIDPTGAVTGSITGRVYTVATDPSNAITLDGTPQTVTTAVGQNGAWTFTGIAGQRAVFSFTGGTYSSAWLKIAKPDGGTLTNAGSYGCEKSCSFDALTLPATGTYTIVIDPTGIAAGSLTGQAFLVPADAAAMLTADGPAQSVTTTANGQDAVFAFTGTAGQRVFVDLAGGTFGNDDGWAKATAYKPDGSVLADMSWCGRECELDTTTLPATGAYKIVVDAYGTSTGSITGRIYSVAADPTKTVTLNGTPQTITTGVGQNGTWTFTGTAGQRVVFDFSGGTYTKLTPVSITKPDGSFLTNSSWYDCQTTCWIDAVTLPATGTYTIKIDPLGTTTGASTARLTAVVDTTKAITVGSAAQIVTTAAGQNAVFTFSGTAGQRVLVDLTGGTFGTDNGYAKTAIYKPDGSILADLSWCGRECQLDTTTLPATGTYKIVIDGYGTSTGSITGRIYSVAADPTKAVALNGTPQTITTGIGQNGTWTFTGTAGQRVALDFSAGTYNKLTPLSITKPDGTVLTSSPWYDCATACWFDTMTLPATGTYTIKIDPLWTTTGALTARAYTVPTDATKSTTIGGTAQTVTTTVPGQNAALTFSGTAGQRVNVSLTQNTLGNTTFSLRGPDGTTLTSVSSATNATLPQITLPSSGQYTVLINPTGNTVGSVTGAITTS